MVIAVCFSFSSGLPFLYVIVCVYFITSYYFNKWMLLRFYQKTFEFNEHLPEKSAIWIRVSILLHIIFAIWQMLNQNVHHYGEERKEHLSFKTDYNEIVKSNQIQLHSSIIIAGMAILFTMIIIDSQIYPFSEKLITKCISLTALISCKCNCLKKNGRDINGDSDLLDQTDMTIQSKQDGVSYLQR